MASIEVFSALSTDGTRALIQFEEDGKTITEKVMGTEELGVFITQLGRLRASMAEKVPRKLDPQPVFRDVTRLAAFHVDREHAVSREFFIALRHEGYGWLAFTFNQEQGQKLTALAIGQVTAMSPTSPIIQPGKPKIIT